MAGTKKNKKLFVWTASIVVVILICFGACAIYLGDYYRADTEAINRYVAGDFIAESTLDSGIMIFEPQDATDGFIFYPGGKVEYDAYIPLMRELSSKGILCVLVPMPFNLAVLDINAADGIHDLYPKIEHWYMGGHSLGGSMAATYISAHSDEFEGLVLLGAYSTADLSSTDLDVLSIYGSEDRIMNKDKYVECISNLPISFTETVIAGGCHAYFGVYGAQDGDGLPSISNENQIEITVDAISKLITRGEE